jgi:hypothetical protein
MTIIKHGLPERIEKQAEYNTQCFECYNCNALFSEATNKCTFQRLSTGSLLPTYLPYYETTCPCCGVYASTHFDPAKQAKVIALCKKYLQEQ